MILTIATTRGKHELLHMQTSILDILQQVFPRWQTHQRPLHQSGSDSPAPPDVYPMALQTLLPLSWPSHVSRLHHRQIWTSLRTARLTEENTAVSFLLRCSTTSLASTKLSNSVVINLCPHLAIHFHFNLDTTFPFPLTWLQFSSKCVSSACSHNVDFTYWRNQPYVEPLHSSRSSSSSPWRSCPHHWIPQDHLSVDWPSCWTLDRGKPITEDIRAGEPLNAF